MPSFRSENYRCEGCGNIDEYFKEHDLDSFPTKIKCSKCQSDSNRIWGLSTFDISQGKCGNVKNKWKGGIFNHPSVLGKYKGTRIK
jgi:ribosomal protein S27E